jgi:hypothetical protein
MLWKLHGTNFFHIKLLDHTNIICQNGPVLPPAQVFYFNGQALHLCFMSVANGTIDTPLMSQKKKEKLIYLFYLFIY